MDRVDRLLTASLVTIDVVDPATPDAQACLAAYFAELDERFDAGFDPARSLTAGVDELRLPHGLFVVARLHGEPVGCGGVKLYADRPAYIKRMWVSPATRGLVARTPPARRARGAGCRARRRGRPAGDEPDARRGDRHVPLGGLHARSPRSTTSPTPITGSRSNWRSASSGQLRFTPPKQSVSARSVPLGERRRAGPSTETPNGRWAGSAHSSGRHAAGLPPRQPRSPCRRRRDGAAVGSSDVPGAVGATPGVVAGRCLLQA